MKKNIVCLFCAAAMLAGCASTRNVSSDDAQAVIFETDMGNDIDDALALDLLYKAMDEGRINLLAVSCHKKSDYAPEFVDVMNTWYGYPDIEVSRGGVCIANDEAVDYAKAVCLMEDEFGQPLFERTKKADQITESVEMYRRLLSAQKDSSVVLISVGFSTTLAALLQSGPDEYSPQTGRELVERKVKLTSIMAGSFGEGARAEYNIVNDTVSARYVFDRWPSPIALSPFELGRMIQYPGSSIQNDFKWAEDHPMVEAYSSYKKMPYNRATWDLTSVLYVLHPHMFTVSERGRLSVDEAGFTHFLPEEDGRDVVLSADRAQADSMMSYFRRTLARVPKSMN